MALPKGINFIGAWLSNRPILVRSPGSLSVLPKMCIYRFKVSEKHSILIWKQNHSISTQNTDLRLESCKQRSPSLVAKQIGDVHVRLFLVECCLAWKLPRNDYLMSSGDRRQNVQHLACKTTHVLDMQPRAENRASDLQNNRFIGYATKEKICSIWPEKLIIYWIPLDYAFRRSP